MSKHNPAFSEKKTLGEIGITEATAAVPKGWKRVLRRSPSVDAELARLFSERSLKVALRQALRQVRHDDKSQHSRKAEVREHSNIGKISQA